ncbi:transposase [Mycobacterium szulgai]|nr:transposase [Mycobacterium szulgai]
MVVWMGIDIAVRAPHQASLANEKGELLWSAHRCHGTTADLEKLWARVPTGQAPSDVTVLMESTRNAWVPLAAWFRRGGARVVLAASVLATRCAEPPKRTPRWSNAALPAFPPRCPPRDFGVPTCIRRSRAT